MRCDAMEWTHLDRALHDEAMIGLQRFLIRILQMRLERLLVLCIVVDVLEEGADQLEAALQPEQRRRCIVVDIHIQHYHVFQILVFQNVCAIDLG